MSTKKPRLWNPKPHKAVDWNEKAIARRLEKGPLYAGIKYDGFRCLITKLNGDVRITTREGIEIPSLAAFRPQFAELLDGYHDRVLDAEVKILGLPFEEMSGHLRRDTPLVDELLPAVKFVIFDLVRTAVVVEGGDSPPRYDRLSPLRWRVQRDAPHQEEGGLYLEAHVEVYTLADIARLYATVRRAGHEGLVLKDPLLGYRNGKVSGWWKVKPGCGADFAPGFEADGVVVGYVWGDDEKSNAGKIVGFRVKLEDGSEVNATGLTQAQMQQYTGNYHATVYEVGVNQTIYIGRHCRVSGMERTKDGSIRHPHFDGFRDIGGTKA